MSDLTEDLVLEILSRVSLISLRSLRSTCKKWNALSRSRLFGDMSETKKNQFLGFMVIGFNICSVSMDLQGIHNDGHDFIDIKKFSVLNQISASAAYPCDGLLLCTLYDKSKLLVWNPYLGQKRWIQYISQSFHNFSLGYDNYRNHKILDVCLYKTGDRRFKIYELSSNSWRVLNVTPNWKDSADYPNGVTLKGNAYFCRQDRITLVDGTVTMEHFLLCFDFTTEKFGPRLSLPFQSPFHRYSRDIVVLSCVRDEQLSVLHQCWQKRDILEIWVTNKIDYNEVLLTKWMEVDMKFLTDYWSEPFRGSFFVDEENKVAVVFHQDKDKNFCFNQTVHIIGQDGYLKSINIGQYGCLVKPDLFGYYPSLVQIE